MAYYPPAYSPMSPYLQPVELRRYRFPTEKTFSVEDFTIRDEYDRQVFNVRGNASSMTQNVVIQNLSGE